MPRPVLCSPLCGPIAAVTFAGSVVLFGAWRPAFSHSIQWVSELGSLGSPNAVAFNLIAFSLTGSLTVAFAASLRGRFDAGIGLALLAASGLFFALIGALPLQPPVEGPINRLHSLSAHLSALSFGAALISVAPGLRSHGEFEVLGRMTPWFLLFLVLYPASELFALETGIKVHAWGQRVGLAGIFLWMALAGWRGWRTDRRGEAGCTPAAGALYRPDGSRSATIPL